MCLPEHYYSFVGEHFGLKTGICFNDTSLKLGVFCLLVLNRLIYKSFSWHMFLPNWGSMFNGLKENNGQKKQTCKPPSSKILGVHLTSFLLDRISLGCQIYIDSRTQLLNIIPPLNGSWDCVLDFWEGRIWKKLFPT